MHLDCPPCPIQYHECGVKDVAVKAVRHERVWPTVSRWPKTHGARSNSARMGLVDLCCPMIACECEPLVCKAKDCCGFASACVFPKRQPRDARGFTPSRDLPSSESTRMTGRVRHYPRRTRPGSAEDARRLSHAMEAQCSCPAGLHLRASNGRVLNACALMDKKRLHRLSRLDYLLLHPFYLSPVLSLFLQRVGKDE